MKPIALVEIQVSLQTAIRSGHLSEEASDLIIEKPPISIAARLKIYQDAYKIRLRESLREDFRRVREHLGAEAFEKLIADFINTHPSTYRDLAEYSGEFPNFLRSQGLELAELGLQDWLQILSETAGSPQFALSAEDIQAGKPFRIGRHPSVHLEKSVAFASYVLAGEVHFRQITARDFALLEFLKSPREMEELLTFAQTAYSEAELPSLISEWLELSILYCEELKS